MSRPIRIGLLIVFIFFIPALLCAQGFRATITGIVTDPSGAAVPRARVTVTNTSTNVKSSGVTNSAGLYVISYLNPGPYEITVQAAGFRTAMRRGITLTVAQQLKLDFALKLGSVHQRVTVSSQAPLLNTVSATSGQTVSERSIAELPQADGNPYALARLAPGIAYYGSRQFERLIDQDATSSIRINGAPGMSQFTLDGIPEGVSTGNVEPAQIHGTKHGMEHVAEDTNGSNGNFPAFVPPRDAVQEFQLTTSPFSAEYGHSAGGTMNVVFKNGTNKLHGDIYEFDRNTAFFAHNFFEDATGQPKAPLHYNRYGGSIGGPVVIPKIYNGRNKTFFFFAGQGFGMSSPSPSLFTTPTPAERQGDFSALLPAGVNIYNPYSAVATTNGLVERTPFTGNIITPADLPTAGEKAASQIGQNLLQVYPVQNLPCANKYCENNYYSPQTTTDNYNLEMARVDEAISDKDRISVNWYREMRRQVEDEWAGSVNGQLPAAKGLTRPVDGAGYEQTYTFSPSMVLDVRLGFSTRVETHFLPTAGTITPQSLGFPASTASLFQGGNFMPYLQVDHLKDMPNIKGPDFQRSTVYSLDPTLMKTVGRQTFQFGYDGRVYRLGSSSLSCAVGCYEFKTNYTEGPYNTSGGKFGQGIAALYLGLPTGGEETVNGSFNNQMRYNAFFVQDNWSVKPKLTLNLGLRYGIEGPVTERFNQNARGFNLTSPNPIQAAALAAYDANPPVAGGTIQPPSPSAFNVLGGVTFASAQNRNIYNADANNFQPRVGVAYELNSKTVIRGGWGMFMIPHNFWGMNQPGFTQNTDVHESNNNGLTFVGNLYNPFPSGIVAPSGSSLGLRTYLGQGITYYPLNQQNGMTQEWQLDVQRQLSRNWLVDAEYIGNHGYDLLAATSNLDALPMQYLSTQPIRDSTVIDNLSTTEPNPFHDLAPGSSLNGSDTTLYQLLLPYPEFTGINSFAFNGTSDYDALDVTVKKRFSHGFSLLADYTWSKLLASDILLNPQDTHYTRSISPLDQPQRFVFSGIWHVPVGHGLRFGTNWHGPLQAILGGWQGQWIYSADSGLPLVFPNATYYNGDPASLQTNIKGSTVSTGTFPISGFYPGGVVDPNNTAIQLSDHYRTFPYILPNFREEAVNNADIEVQKSFHFGESRSLQIKADLQNAFNHPLFGAPNLSPTSSSFSQVTSQVNFPRNIQLGAWLNF